MSSTVGYSSTYSTGLLDLGNVTVVHVRVRMGVIV